MTLALAVVLVARTSEPPCLDGVALVRSFCIVYFVTERVELYIVCVPVYGIYEL